MVTCSLVVAEANRSRVTQFWTGGGRAVNALITSRGTSGRGFLEIWVFTRVASDCLRDDGEGGTVILLGLMEVEVEVGVFVVGLGLGFVDEMPVRMSERGTDEHSDWRLWGKSAVLKRRLRQ